MPVRRVSPLAACSSIPHARTSQRKTKRKSPLSSRGIPTSRLKSRASRFHSIAKPTARLPLASGGTPCDIYQFSPDKKKLRALGLPLPLRSFAMSQRRFRALNCLLGLPSAGFEGTATTPSLQRGGLEDTSSSLKTICIIQRDTNDGREANEILRSGSESPADRS